MTLLKQTNRYCQQKSKHVEFRFGESSQTTLYNEKNDKQIDKADHEWYIVGK